MVNTATRPGHNHLATQGCVNTSMGFAGLVVRLGCLNQIHMLTAIVKGM